MTSKKIPHVRSICVLPQNKWYLLLPILFFSFFISSFIFLLLLFSPYIINWLWHRNKTKWIGKETDTVLFPIRVLLFTDERCIDSGGKKTRKETRKKGVLIQLQDKSISGMIIVVVEEDVLLLMIRLFFFILWFIPWFGIIIRHEKRDSFLKNPGFILFFPSICLLISFAALDFPWSSTFFSCLEESIFKQLIVTVT